MDPLMELIRWLFLVAIFMGAGVIALIILSRRPGAVGKVSTFLLEVLTEVASGASRKRSSRSRNRSSRRALERAFEKSPSIPSEDFPFKLDAKAYFFTKAEGTFYPELVKAAAELGFLVFPKVGLCDLFVDKKGADRSQYARYAQMHVDYLLVRESTYAPVAGIELNGASHLAEKQQANDRKKKAVFSAAGLPLLTFYNQPSYSAWEVQTKLQDVLGPGYQASGR